MELMILKPSFAKKLNQDGFSPLHLAVQSHQIELALELIKFDPSLVRIRGRGGMTPLHLVAKNGDVELLTEFLLACPESIKDVNLNGETAIHITVMNDNYEELKVLTGWMQKMRHREGEFTEIHVLNRRDREGNTALHLAAYDNNEKAIKQLLKCMSLNRNIQNKSGKTALDVLRIKGPDLNIAAEKIIIKAGGKSAAYLSSNVETTSVFLRKPVTFREYCATAIARYRSGFSDGSRNALLVITALIITATYTTAVQPQEKDHQENLTWNAIVLEIVLLWGFNTISFLSAIVLTFKLLPLGGAYNWWYFLITGPLVGSYAISIYNKYVSPLFMTIYFMTGLGFLVYLLVFYLRWKRTTHKKVPKPKSTELISQGLKTMV